MQANQHIVTWKEILDRISTWDKALKYYGIPRGGQYIAAALNPVDTPEQADIIVDDLVDSGATFEKWRQLYPGKHFMAVFDKRIEYQGQWLRFPWEQDGDMDVEEHMRRVIQNFDDANREGLSDTPRRYIKFLREFLSPPDFGFTTFNSEGMDEMIVVKDIPFYSLCEHHLAPFFGKAHIAYVPTDKIVGLSKLPRTVEFFSRRFQNQERITQQVADLVQKSLTPKGVAVVLEAQHLCMAMRGVRKHDVITTTSKMVGVFRTDQKAREEFLQLIRK